MKKHFYFMMMGALIYSLSSCNDKNNQYDDTGTVSALTLEGPSAAFMGDSLTFNFSVSGADIPVNTSKVQIIYGEDIVSERVVVTNHSGNYSGSIYIPFLKDVADGTAKVKMRVQNERFIHDSKTVEIEVKRPEFPYLTLYALTPTENDPKARTEYKMLPVQGEKHTYAVTGEFPTSDLSAYIVAPKYGDNGNEIPFGMVDGKITQGVDSDIEFTSDIEGTYQISFNTQNYIGLPFVKFAINDIEFERLNDNEFKVEMEFKQGEDIEVTGLKADYENYWIDPSFFKFKKGTDGKVLVFRGMTAKYRFTVNKTLKYFMVELMNGNAISTFNADTKEGAVWCIGNAGIGRPSYSANGVNWTPNKGFCLAPLGNKKHLLVLEGGKNLNLNSIDFKFFAQQGWGWEFTGPRIALADNSKWFVIDAGSGNIGKGTTVPAAGKFYYITVDVSELPAKMSVEEKDAVEEVE